MTFSRKGFVYRVAYPKWWSNYQPNAVSVCRLFWRFLVMAFITYPVVQLIVVISHIFGFLFASRGIRFSSNVPRPYRNWPTVRGHRVWPISVLASMGLAFVAFKNYKLLLYPSLLLGLLFVLLAILVGITWLSVDVVPKMRRSEVGRLVTEYVRAKKEKICPLIKVTD